MNAAPLSILAMEGMGTLVAQSATVIVAFLTVMFILKKFAWGPIIGALDERRETIRKSFDDIDQRQAKLAGQLKDYEERLRLIDDEARQRLNKSVEEGRRIAQEIEAKAKEDAEASLARARQAIQIETDKARVELRNEIVALSIGTAERLLKMELNDDRHRQLVNSYIAEMQDKTAK